MAPEFFQEPINYTQKVDVYALGIVIYELLVGTVPFDYQKHEESITQVKNGNILSNF